MDEMIGIKEALLLSRAGADDSARLVMAVLTTARRIDAACAELLARRSLSEGRFAVLLAVSTEPRVTPRTIADRLEVTSATVTGLLDRLDRDELIERRPHPTDRRTHTLEATAAGQRLVSELVPIYARWLSRLGSGITVSEREDALLVLAAVQQNLTSGGVA